MGFLSVLSMAHKWIAERVAAGDAVIDATAGTGVDTLKLAELVGAKGTIYAFDVQQEALEQTKARLDRQLEPDKHPQLYLLLRDHALMVEALDDALFGRIAAVMFNLGYLPGGDASIMTKPASSIQALEAALTLLRAGGIVTCALYPGHAGGDSEAAAVEAWAAALPSDRGQVVMYRQLQRTTAPYLIAIEKRG
ncbi:class I SAM-dependent methyltransferase [Paenibacillus sp. HB172176]|uniref:class I SAM-dependent methyltransferase n=1 Tax=Paenibacillus sp. HB172176 TaxID=2493690 RepID=UPI001439C107|nr:class I SAM-dependent methyltransferase [Paenibacillus sp. HB172176]